MARFSPYEERILRVLASGRRALSTNAVSDYSGISYNATRSNLERLYRNKVIHKAIRGNRIYWCLEVSYGKKDKKEKK